MYYLNTSKILTAAIVILLSAGIVLADEVRVVDFENGAPETLISQGRDGGGLTYTNTDWALIEPDILEIDVDPGSLRTGAVAFDLKRLDFENDGRTVVAFLDPEGAAVMRIKIRWDSGIRPGFPMVRFHGSNLYMKSSHNLFGFELLLDQPVAIGEWVNIAFVWDDMAEDYGVFVNGRRQDTSPRAYDFITGQIVPLVDPQTDDSFGWDLSSMEDVMADVVKLRLGIHCADSRERCTSPLANAVLDNFRILDSSPASEIALVSHNAFEIAGYSGKLVAGDAVAVKMIAEPEGKASCNVGDVLSDVPMAEDVNNPGIYRGTYIVLPGSHSESGVVTCDFINRDGFESIPSSAAKFLDIDGRVHMAVNPSNDLVPADEDSRAGITVVATDANGKELRDRKLKLTMSTTDEYTGLVGGGTFEDQVGAELDVEWKGVTDSFGEVSAEYVSGFAAKTILISAKDMSTGDVGVGWVRSYIEGEVDIVVKQPAARALAVTGSMEVSVSRDWLTADGRSRSRITAVVKDTDGIPMEGNQISFNLLSDNGSIRQIQTRTDSRGRAYADYIAGTVVGQVQIEVRDMTSGLVALVGIELRPDAPAEISLTADPGEVFIGDSKGSVITAKVTDINNNPNTDTDVLFEVIVGDGAVSAPKVSTDDRDGVAEVTFLPGTNPGVVTVKATVMSREPTVEEIEAAEGAVFLYGLEDDPGRLEVLEWLAAPEDEVVEGQDLVVLEDRAGDTYTVKAPQDGTLATFTAEERDRVEYGQTLGYVLPLPE